MQLEDIMKFLEEIKKFQNNGSFYTVSENDKTRSEEHTSELQSPC